MHPPRPTTDPQTRGFSSFMEKRRLPTSFPLIIIVQSTLSDVRVAAHSALFSRVVVDFINKYYYLTR